MFLFCFKLVKYVEICLKMSLPNVQTASKAFCKKILFKICWMLLKKIFQSCRPSVYLHFPSIKMLSNPLLLLLILFLLTMITICNLSRTCPWMYFLWITAFQFSFFYSNKCFFNIALMMSKFAIAGWLKILNSITYVLITTIELSLFALIWQ